MKTKQRYLIEKKRLTRFTLAADIYTAEGSFLASVTAHTRRSLTEKITDAVTRVENGQPIYV